LIDGDNDVGMKNRRELEEWTWKEKEGGKESVSQWLKNNINSGLYRKTKAGRVEY
jgi:hypothetical protein